MLKSRKNYSTLKQEHISNNHRDPSQEEVDLALHNPLSQEEDVSLNGLLYITSIHPLWKILKSVPQGGMNFEIHLPSGGDF